MQLDEVVDILEKEPVSLFYGAGVSMECGGPSGTDLLSSIKSKFGDSKADSIFEYMDTFIEDDESNRNKVEIYLKEKLVSISPNSTHRYLFSLPWKAILTTNFDHLPDVILETIDKNRSIIPLSDSADANIDQNRRDLLYCFKLMGDVKYRYPSEGFPILTTRDNGYAHTGRTKLIKLFRNLLITGHIVYLGYSFCDEFVFNLLHEMKYILGEIPWKGYAITPNQPSPTIMEMFKKYGIEWIQGTLSDFISESKKRFGDIPISAPSLKRGLTIHNMAIELDRATVSNISRNYKVLTDSDLLPLFSEDPKDFFEGIESTSFYPFTQCWDYPRKVRLISRKSKNPNLERMEFKDLVNLSTSGNSSDNIVMTLTGSAGSGKTIIARRLAFDWYRNGNPVVFINTETVLIDTMVLEGLLDEIWEKYKKESEKRKKKQNELRFLLVADDCSSHFESLVKLKNLLISMGKPADILMVSRKSDLPTNEILKRPVDLVFDVDDTINKSELNNLVSHFSQYNVLNDPVIVKRNLEDPEINTSFFALIYTSVKGINKSLRKIIEDEFNKLDSTSKKIYSIVSLLQSQALTPYFSICAKSGDFSADQLLKQIRIGNLFGIVHYSTDSYKTEEFSRVYGLGFGTDVLFTNNKIIADIIYNRVFTRSGLLHTSLKSIVSAVTPGDEAEVKLLHMLLIEKVRKGAGLQLETAQKISLFKHATNKMKSRPLLHHLAKLQMYARYYDDAKMTLKNALDAETIKGHEEKRENIIDSMARVELGLSDKALQKKNESEAWDHLDKAERLFNKAMISPIESPHPYQGLGRTYVAKSKLVDDDENKMRFCLLALRICSFMENNSDVISVLALKPLKDEATAEIQKLGLDEEKARRIRDHLGMGDGYAFLAEIEISNGNFDYAMQLVDEGLSKDKKSLWIIRTKVHLIRILYPEDYEQLQNEIERYLSIVGAKFDIRLSFELAMVTFKLGEYITSHKLFSELYSRSKYNPERVTPIEMNRWTEGGKPKEFHGVIRRIPKPGRFGSIECLSLPNYRKQLTVRMNDVLFEPKGNDRILFEITFNMAGPQASRVRRLA